LLSFEDALERLLAAAVPLGPERVPLDAAAGRVLYEDVLAPDAMPAFDQSSMDGYAVRHADLGQSGPWVISVVGESAAGSAPADHAAGTACRIFTGAPLPRGADTILLQEDVDRREGAAGSSEIRFTDMPPLGTWVRRRGHDIQEGATALSSGLRLTPGRIAMAAAMDRPQLLVRRSPIVTIVGSGDELRCPGEARREGSIPESNGYFIAATARTAGAIARIAPFVRDDLEQTTEGLVAALRTSDLVVTIGGVSVGDHDVMRPALSAAGVELDFWRVAIKPGKPLAVGHRDSTHVLGLPGNPASASLTFLLYGVPLLRALQGDAQPLPMRMLARVRGSVRRKPGRMEFLRAKLEVLEGKLVADLLSNQSSGAATSMAMADALVVVPAPQESVTDGELLEVIRISDA